MLVYLIRRIAYVIPIVFGVSLILFVLFHMVGGDPTYQMLGQHADARSIEILRQELGLDQPKSVQFLNYLKQVVTFDYGISYASKEKISDMILSRISPSFSLAVLGFLVTLLMSLGLALIVAYFRGTWIDQTVVVFSVMGMSISALAFILFGQYVLGYQLGWFPISGYSESFPDRLFYLIMPAGIWVLVSLGADIRFFRTSLLDETYQDYVRTGRAKGLTELKIFGKHILKNSLVPIISYLVIQIPFLILGSFLLENYFGIPGLGSMTIDAVNNSDFPVLKAMATLYSLLFILGNLLTDILYKIVDPRMELL